MWCIFSSWFCWICFCPPSEIATFCVADEQDPRDRDAKSKADRYRAASDEQDRKEDRDKDGDTEERDVRAMALPAEAILDDTTPSAAYRDKERESKDAAGDRPIGIDGDVALVRVP